MLVNSKNDDPDDYNSGSEGDGSDSSDESDVSEDPNEDIDGLDVDGVTHSCSSSSSSSSSTAPQRPVLEEYEAAGESQDTRRSSYDKAVPVFHGGRVSGPIGINRFVTQMIPKKHSKLARGTLNVLKLENSDGHSYFLSSWLDSKPVNVLHTYPTAVDKVDRGSVDANGNFVKIKVSRPTVISNYNHRMGGTDKFDQLCSYYRTSYESDVTHR